MKYGGYENVIPKGELGARCALLSARLEAPIYRTDVIFSIESAGWPGDWEGRTVLALTCLCEATKREPSYLDGIVSQLPSHLNEKGQISLLIGEKTKLRHDFHHGRILGTPHVPIQ